MLLMVEGGGWEDSIGNSRGGDAVGYGALGEEKAPPPIAEVVMLLVVEGWPPLPPSHTLPFFLPKPSPSSSAHPPLPPLPIAEVVMLLVAEGGGLETL